MKITSPLSIASLVLGLTVSLQPTTLMAQGPLTPPGGPAPTMRTLTQIEPRTPISSAPVTLSIPGSYYLTTNLTVSSGNAITIATNGVTLDLNGFSITSIAPGATGIGILLSGGLRNVTVLNGHIQGGVTNNAGTYNGPGFGYGIMFAVPPPMNVRVAGVSVSGCLFDGIDLGTNDTTVVEGCTVRTVGNIGISAAMVKNSVALGCGGYGINGKQVSDSRGESVGVVAGILADIAQNCYGSSQSGYGLYAYRTAQNCYGYSTNSHGLFGGSAQNCYGESGGDGFGLDSYMANNCRGYTVSGIGLRCINGVATACFGSSTSSLGLSARIGIGSIGVGTPPDSVLYKYNMP
ncbi:MAG: hypothetical protein M9920_14090 [Verrucomicrobiae bacterium]|nr:hypothetical protein [Verrucomicrobiae bacterium]